jgi:fructan beta-fructosidase
MIVALATTSTVFALSAAGVGLSDVYSRILCEVRGEGNCTSYFVDEFANLEAWNVVKGNWSSEDGKLCGGPKEGQIFNDMNKSDYVITISGADLMQGKGYGVYFRSSDPEKVDGYNFQFDPGYKKGSFTFRKWVNGKKLKPFAVTTAPDFDWYNQDYTIEIRVQGNAFTAYVDGEQVLQATDETYSSGGVGFRTWDQTRACFDGLSVDPLQ